MSETISVYPGYAQKVEARGEYIRRLLQFMSEPEVSFGAMTALLRYGRLFKHVQSPPEWLPKGPMGQCFANSARALMPYVCDKIPPYYYAEGYALEPVHGIYFEHAWLVDAQGHVIDLTWDDSENAVYYGVTFKGKFVLDAMRKTRHFGILGNVQLQNRIFKNHAAFRNVIHQPTLRSKSGRVRQAASSLSFN